MIIDYQEIEPSLRYKLTAQSVIPRPIAWIVTENGVVNVAPFSYFTPLSSNPPTLMVSIGHKSDGSPKDTLRNIRETKKCTVCVGDISQLKKMHYSSKELDKNISEADCFDIDLVYIDKDFPPMIKDVPVAFFCKFYQEIELKESKTIPVILEIKKEYIDKGIVTDKEKFHIDFTPIARIGAHYSTLGRKIAAPEIMG